MLTLFDTRKKQVVAWVALMPSGNWVAVAPDGRFDTAAVEDLNALHWVLPEDPYRPLPLEMFMRQYYEPRLLQKLLAGATLPKLPDIGSLNRTLPEVHIKEVKAVSGENGIVDVALEVGSNTKVQNLRVFRSGQLVGYVDGLLAEAKGEAFKKTFRVRLPAGSGPHEFSAYAFNDDNIKSFTARQSYTPPKAVAAAKPRAWIISIGVNRHQNPDWNLEYASNDARLISESVLKRLVAQDRFAEIIPISLVSAGDGRNLATKAKIKAVLDRLAGREADVSGIANVDKLRRVTPDDLVLISFAGHGVGVDGQFYLIPSDTGTGQGRATTPDLLAHSISSDELALWLRDVDGGDMAMIIDACQSAASVGSDFKPGPMGARGLGQLAYEKGMRILAASQAEENAQESRLTQQGLLSYALVNDGLERAKADHQPKDKKITLAEWLSYGVQRVPSLADEVAKGQLESRGSEGDDRGATRLTAGNQKRRALQQPALFDFTKGRRDATVAVRVTGP